MWYLFLCNEFIKMKSWQVCVSTCLSLMGQYNNGLLECIAPPNLTITGWSAKWILASVSRISVTADHYTLYDLFFSPGPWLPGNKSGEKRKSSGCEIISRYQTWLLMLNSIWLINKSWPNSDTATHPTDHKIKVKKSRNANLQRGFQFNGYTEEMQIRYFEVIVNWSTITINKVTVTISYVRYYQRDHVVFYQPTRSVTINMPKIIQPDLSQNNERSVNTWRE